MRTAKRAAHAARALALALALCALTAPAARAQVVRAFTPRTSVNMNGDITLIGNTIMTCTGNGLCATGHDGTGNKINNDDFNMQYVDVDADGTTFSSSSATLSLPATATVAWAGLYWSGDSNNGARNQVRFATPAAGYVAITASRLDVTGTIYQGFADVTSQVQNGGNGSYTTANVRSTTGAGEFAGWALVVMYRDNTLPPRNLVVFDGYASVVPGATVSFNVSGFVTPISGAVNTRLGVVAGEGDFGFTGDSFLLNGTALSDAQNPSTNFFNSSISLLGTTFTAKNPNYLNQLGWDADLVSANGILPNSATSATIALNSTNDQYYPGVVTFATDLYQPIIEGAGFTKSVTDLNGGNVEPGDMLEYTVSMTNTGADNAIAMVLRDTLDSNVSYVAASLSVASGANTGAKSDATGDDQMEYVAASRSVVARLGSGAGAVSGGTLAPGASTSIKFRVRVNAGLATGTVVSNQAGLTFNGQQLGTPFATRSDGDANVAGSQPTTVVVTAPPPPGVNMSGFGYADANHNLARDAGEAGTGATLYAKLVLASAPSSAQQVVPVDPATGAYTFTSVLAGTYTVLLDDNAIATDVTPAAPPAWIATQSAPGLVSGLAVAAVDLGNVNFGYYQGARVDGTVFRDDGAGAGTPNDGGRQAGESGIAGTRIRLLSSACAGGECDSALTDGAGAFRLWIPSAASGPVVVQPLDPGGSISTGGSVGSSGGTYSRAAESVSFTAVNGMAYSGLAFGDVPLNTLVPGGAQSVAPGAVAFYAHRFTAGSSGSATFSTVQVPSPVLAGWNVELYRDLNCNGTVDAGEPLVSGALALSSGQSACLVLKQGAPAGAPSGASSQATLSVSFSYLNAVPALTSSASVSDVTTVDAVGSGLMILKSVSAATARPGDVLTYTITYSNNGPAPISSIVIRDATPAFTVFQSASCATLGAGLTSCAVTSEPAPGAAGSIVWTLTGALAPGASGSVSYQVRVP
jgi:uncharacterized repeat protein (TIGR01451 family)